MKKKIIILLCVILVILLILHLFVLYVMFGTIFPGKKVEKAVTIPRHSNYIVCTEEKVTDYDWMMYDKNFKPLECINIINDEVITEKYNYDFDCQVQYYYIYGHFAEDNEFGKVFVLEDYDIIFPIKHGVYSLLFLSPKYTYEIELDKETEGDGSRPLKK